jgi:hypothetical protein
MKVLTVHRNKIQLKWDNLFSRWGNFMAETQYVDRAIAMQLLGDTGPVTVVSAECKLTLFCQSVLNLLSF